MYFSIIEKKTLALNLKAIKILRSTYQSLSAVFSIPQRIETVRIRNQHSPLGTSHFILFSLGLSRLMNTHTTSKLRYSCIWYHILGWRICLSPNALKSDLHIFGQISAQCYVVGDKETIDLSRVRYILCVPQCWALKAGQCHFILFENL